MQVTQWESVHSKSVHSENQDQQKSIATKITVRATGLFFFFIFQIDYPIAACSHRVSAWSACRSLSSYGPSRWTRDFHGSRHERELSHLRGGSRVLGRASRSKLATRLASVLLSTTNSKERSSTLIDACAHRSLAPFSSPRYHGLIAVPLKTQKKANSSLFTSFFFLYYPFIRNLW